MASFGLMSFWLSTVLGKKLLSVNALLHVFLSKRDSSPQELCLLFEGAEACKLYGGPDFSFDPILNCDLGEYGCQEVFCVSDELYFSNVVGHQLVLASLVQSSAEETVIGVALSFSSGFCLSVLNLGDEFFVYDEIPEDIVFSEGLSLISVK